MFGAKPSRRTRGSHHRRSNPHPVSQHRPTIKPHDAHLAQSVDFDFEALDSEADALPADTAPDAFDLLRAGLLIVIAEKGKRHRDGAHIRAVALAVLLRLFPSISEAARQCNVTKPALWRAYHALRGEIRQRKDGVSAQ